MERVSIVVVAGPTASGKSALALALAEKLGGTIVNADSMQVYRGLAILTAQPRAAALTQVPHRLYGEVDPAIAFSAGAWRKRAEAEIDAAREAGRVPILVGGTGLYLRALLEGLAPVPSIPAEVRADARALHEKIGAAEFHRALAELDPDAAARLRVSDTLRVLRAYEVVRATGSTLAGWQREQQRGSRYDASVVLLSPERAALYPACDTRFAGMIEAGAVEEVRALMARQLDPALPAMRALGVREIAAWLDGETGREEAIAAAQQATRNYAKRQGTWFRHQLPERQNLRKLVLAAQFSERLLSEIFSFIR